MIAMAQREKIHSILEGHEALCTTDMRGFTRTSKSRGGDEKCEHLEQRKSELAMAPNGVWAWSIWRRARGWECAGQRDIEGKRNEGRGRVPILETIISKILAFLAKGTSQGNKSQWFPRLLCLNQRCHTGWVRFMCCWSSLPPLHGNTVNFRVTSSWILTATIQYKKTVRNVFLKVKQPLYVDWQTVTWGKALHLSATE